MAPESDAMIFTQMILDGDQPVKEAKRVSDAVSASATSQATSLGKVDAANEKTAKSSKVMGTSVAKDTQVAASSVANMAKVTEQAEQKIKQAMVGMGGATTNAQFGFRALTSGAQQFFSIANKISPTFASWTVAAYGLYQSLMFVSKTIGALAEQADKFTSLSRGFETLTQRIHESGAAMLDEMSPAAQGLVTKMDLMKQANSAIILQLPITAENMTELSEIAIKLGRAMGIDAPKALESIILGIGRESNRLLDNIGILVDTEKAHGQYAESIGKTVEQLTEVEKRQGFFNETMKVAKARVAGLGEETVTATEYTKKAGVALYDTWSMLAKSANVSIGEMITGLKALNKDILEFRLQHPSLWGLDMALEINDKFSAGAVKIPKEVSDRVKQSITEMFKNEDPGGLALARGYEKMDEALQRLGVDIPRVTSKVKDLKEGIDRLKDKRAVFEDLGAGGRLQVQALSGEIKKLEEELNRLLGIKKGVKKLIEEGGGAFHGVGKPPEGFSSPSTPQPFDEVFGKNLDEKQKAATASLESVAAIQVESFLDRMFNTDDDPTKKALDLINNFTREALELKADYVDTANRLDKKQLSTSQMYAKEQLRLIQVDEDAEIAAAEHAAQARQSLLDKTAMSDELRRTANIKLTELNEQAVTNIHAKHQRARKALSDSTFRAQMQQWSMISGMAGAAVQQAFGKSKAGAVAAILMNTGSAVMNAMASLPYPYNIVAAAISSAMGAYELSQVKSVSLSGSGSIGSVSSGAANYSGATNTPATSKTVTGTTPVIVGGIATSGTTSTTAPSPTQRVSGTTAPAQTSGVGGTAVSISTPGLAALLEPTKKTADGVMQLVELVSSASRDNSVDSLGITPRAPLATPPPASNAYMPFTPVPITKIPPPAPAPSPQEDANVVRAGPPEIHMHVSIMTPDVRSVREWFMSPEVVRIIGEAYTRFASRT